MSCKESEIIELFQSRPAIALVGATENSQKFGSIIYRNLVNRDYTVIPINPGRSILYERTCFPDLSEAATVHKIALVVFVVPPRITLKGVQEAEKLGLNHIWIQPGAGDGEVEAYLKKNGFCYLMNHCVMHY